MNNAENQPLPQDTYPEPGYWINVTSPPAGAEQGEKQASPGRIVFRPQLDSIEGHDSPIAAVAFFPGGDKVVSLDINWGLIVWGANLGVPIQRYQLDENLGSVRSLQVSPDGRLLIVDIYSSFDNIQCAVWDLQSEQMRYTLPGKANFYTGVIIIATPKPAIVALEGSDLTVWDLESGRLLHTLGGHTRPIRAVTVVPNSTLVLTASEDATIKLWDISTGQERVTYHHHTSMVLDVVVSADGRLAASSSTDNTLQLWDVRTGQTVHVFENFFNHYLCMQTQGRMLISRSEDRFKVWNLDRKEQTISVEVFTEDILDGVGIIPNSNLAFFVMDDWLTGYHYMLHVFDMECGEVIASFRDSNRINHYAVAPSGKMIALGDFDGKVHFVDCFEPQV